MFKYNILQIADTSKGGGCPYAFMRYDFAKTHGFNIVTHYKESYSGGVAWADSETHPYNILESLFVKFNQHRPDDFFGHSLSVSDVVILGYENSPSRFFYCDSFGWKEITTEATSVTLI